MNGDVERLVDLLFKDIEENEEVRAIRDEVMNNCRDRYDDLTASGYSEEEAIAAVAESLRGMEEVLKDYPRKAAYPGEMGQMHPGFEKPVDDMYGICWDGVLSLRIDVRNADVEVAVSEGEKTVDLTQGGDSILRAWTEGDTLVIRQEKRGPEAGYGLNGIDGMLGMLKGLLDTVLDQVSFNDDCRVRLALPRNMLKNVQIHTLSGDISFGTPAERIELKTTSGDLRIAVPSFPLLYNEAPGRLPILKAESISGDIDAEGRFSQVFITTTSGDIGFTGSSGEMRLKTVSGDIEADAVSPSVSGSTVSGDVDLTMKDTARGEIAFDTVSGDIDLKVPGASCGIRADVNTRSGETICDDLMLNDDAPLRVRLSTVSGDVSIRR